jgi:SAM-dependent methyltransferase
MAKYDARDIRGLLQRRENITEWVRAREGSEINSPDAILYAYDAQAGSYIDHLNTPGARELNERLGQELGALLDELAPGSLLEAGIGEGTSLAAILRHMKLPPACVLGLDLSLSRLLFARSYLAAQEQNNVELFTGDFEHVPLANASVDVVLTIHAIEPNRGREEAILAELLRVARTHLVMIEPSYEMASAEARNRMDRLGYVRGLPQKLEQLGQRLLRVARWPHSSNPLNEAALIVVEKAPQQPESVPRFISPISGADLIRRADCWFCPQDGHAFPILAGIPCLTIDNAVLASKLGAF